MHTGPFECLPRRWWKRLVFVKEEKGFWWPRSFLKGQRIGRRKDEDRRSSAWLLACFCRAKHEGEVQNYIKTNWAWEEKTPLDKSKLIKLSPIYIFILGTEGERHLHHDGRDFWLCHRLLRRDRGFWQTDIGLQCGWGGWPRISCGWADLSP